MCANIYIYTYIYTYIYNIIYIYITGFNIFFNIFKESFPMVSASKPWIQLATFTKVPKSWIDISQGGLDHHHAWQQRTTTSCKHPSIMMHNDIYILSQFGDASTLFHTPHKLIIAAEHQESSISRITKARSNRNQSKLVKIGHLPMASMA